MNKIGFVAPPEPSKPRELSEGEQPYMLTRLEYLEIKLNTVMGVTHSLEDISGYFSAMPSQNTMIITCHYSSDVNSEIVEDLISSMGKLLMDYLKLYGWEEWVKIEVQKDEF